MTRNEGLGVGIPEAEKLGGRLSGPKRTNDIESRVLVVVLLSTLQVGNSLLEHSSHGHLSHRTVAAVRSLVSLVLVFYFKFVHYYDKILWGVGDFSVFLFFFLNARCLIVA
jgi:hypothetical protein